MFAKVMQNSFSQTPVRPHQDGVRHFSVGVERTADQFFYFRDDRHEDENVEFWANRMYHVLDD